MTDIDIDDSEARSLIRELDAVVRNVPDDVAAVVEKAGVNVKKVLRDDLRGSRHFRGAAPSVTYDLIKTPSYVEAEIGPVTGPGRRVGDLASIAYFGGVHGGGGTVRDPMHAAQEEAPRFEKALDNVLGRLG